ncbi:hypothetical protein [Streptomyces violaceusniger]|uniref:hypothetical protein n=1 Tax=Streptomyces violaceusniger TaxID=68280 RepID=UPI0002F8168B|nr:hypothetical protein [Streptomyces violaceusniger]
MSTVIAAMITAVVGILGALFPSLLQQRMTVRQREGARVRRTGGAASRSAGPPTPR